RSSNAWRACRTEALVTDDRMHRAWWTHLAKGMPREAAPQQAVIELAPRGDRDAAHDDPPGAAPGAAVLTCHRMAVAHAGAAGLAGDGAPSVRIGASRARQGRPG